MTRETYLFLHQHLTCIQVKYSRKAAKNACRAAGLGFKLDDQRGWDHGVFVPLKLMYPHADIPVVEMSMLKSLDAQVGTTCTPAS